MALVKVHVHERTGTIILNRPEKRNALSRALLAELDQALGDLHLERRVRAVVLTGSGPAFCAGMDLSEMLETSRQPDANAMWHSDAMIYHDLVLSMLRFPKPLIAAVNGPAVAGGAGLMLACDIVVAAESATFGLPEPLRGIIAGIVAPLVHFRIGGGQAARLLMTAATIDATEAQRIGLFHELIDADRLWPRAGEIAAQCAALCSRGVAIDETCAQRNDRRKPNDAARRRRRRQRYRTHDRGRRRRPRRLQRETRPEVAVAEFSFGLTATRSKRSLRVAAKHALYRREILDGDTPVM